MWIQLLSLVLKIACVLAIVLFMVLRQGRSELRCRLMMDKLIAVGGVYLPSGLEQTAHMAGKSSTIEVVYCDEGNH